MVLMSHVLARITTWFLVLARRHVLRSSPELSESPESLTSLESNDLERFRFERLHTLNDQWSR